MVKSLALGNRKCIEKRRISRNLRSFYLPFDGKLSSSNRWVIWANQIPWEEFEEAYRKNFTKKSMRAPGKSVRLPLGALILKERLGTSDEETVAQIQENPYLQYFLGFHGYPDEAPFDPSMLVHFRKCLSAGYLVEINDTIVGDLDEKSDEDDDVCRESQDECCFYHFFLVVTLDAWTNSRT